MSALRVVLASASPRRRELLSMIGVVHDVVPADIDERYLPGEAPAPHAERLAREKASAVAALRAAADALVIAADTIVVVDGDVLGKPSDRAQAAAMLRRLSGRSHTVHTAVAVRHGDREAFGVESPLVTFRELDAATIEAYIDTGEPMDKAGAYGIQGFGATLVRRVEGDYFAVMGLPLQRTIALAESLGAEYRFRGLRAAARR
jgi:septum formation protein